MSDHDVFKTTKETNPQPSADPVADLLSQIKNEAGENKYRSVEDAIKALAHSQAFIPQLQNEKKSLEEELNQLREQAKKFGSMDEVIEKLKAAGKQEEPEKTTSSAVGLSEEAVLNLVRKTLEDRDSASKSQTNAQKVQSALISKFGEKANEQVVKKAQALGTTAEKLGDLAKENPELVLALFDTSVPKASQSTSSSFNIHAAPPVPELKRPEKSLLLGATSKQQLEFMQKVKEDVYRRLGVQS